MAGIVVKDQAALDKALKKLQPEDWIECRAGVFDAYDSTTVRAYDSATVYASGSATVRAYDSATVYAYGSATVRAYDSTTVRAARCVAIHLQAKSAVTVEGGVVIQPPVLTTAELWAEHYGAEVEGGIVTLYKSLDNDYKSGRGFAYTPGTTPEAPDWDGGKAECGGGLHFCASPFEAARFFEGTKFVACPVRLDEIVVHPDGDYPDKVKAPRVCAPCWEVNLAGERV